MFTEFLGTYAARLDDKGRLTLPATYRGQFSSGVKVSKGQDHCLYVFTLDGFRDFASDVINAPFTDGRARGFQRYMLANTELTHLDGQGRISVPARMREYAGLTKDVAVTGVGTRLEIWDAAAWAAYESEFEEPYSSPERGVLNPD